MDHTKTVAGQVWPMGNSLSQYYKGNGTKLQNCKIATRGICIRSTDIKRKKGFFQHVDWGHDGEEKMK